MEFFTEITLLSAGAVVLVQQILKLNAIPVAFANKYPVPTNILLSIIAAVVVSWQDLMNLSSAWSYMAFIGTVAVLAAVTYNQLISRSDEIRSVEGEGTK